MRSRPTIETKIINCARAVSLIGLVGLLILAGMIVVEVLLRWLFDFPILGIPDASPLIVTVAVASCFPLVFAQKRNVTVRVVGNTLGGRGYSILEAFGSMVALIIFCAFTWHLWRYAGKVAVSHETTLVVGWAIAPWYLAATVLLIMCIPVQLFIFYSEIKSAFYGHGHPEEGTAENVADVGREKEN